MNTCSWMDISTLKTMNTKLPYSSPVLRVDNLNKHPWLVRLVRPGDRYGAEHCRIHGEPRPGRRPTRFDKDPLVEFYSYLNPTHSYDYAGPSSKAEEAGARPLGQLAGSYYATTLLESSGNTENGLCIHAGVPEWCVDHILMQKVMSWLDRMLKVPHDKQPIYTSY